MISLEDAVKQINKSNPFMGELLNCEDPLLEYVKERITTHEFHEEHVKRQEPYAKLIKEKVDRLFKKE